MAILSGFPLTAASPDSQAVDCQTSGVSTTGAKAFILARVHYNGRDSGAKPVDAQGNTWTALTEQGGSLLSTVQIFYVLNPTTAGSGHWFRASDGSGPGSSSAYDCIWVWALDDASITFRNESGGTATSSPTSVAASGSVGANGDFIVSVVSDNLDTGTSQTVDSGLTQSTAYGFVTGQHIAGRAAAIYTAGSALTVGWSSLAGSDAATAVAAFNLGGGGTLFTQSAITTQAQAALQTKQTQTTKVTTQRQTALLSALKLVVKVLLATQAQAVRLVKQAQVTRVLGQAQQAIQTKQTQTAKLFSQAQQVVQTRLTARSRAIGQSTVATLSAMKVALRSLFATQATASTLVKQSQIARVVSQGTALTQTRQTSVTHIATQGTTVSQSRVIGKILRVVQAAVALVTGVIPGASRPRQLYFTASQNPTRSLIASDNSTKNLTASEN